MRVKSGVAPERRVYASIDGGFVPMKKGQNGTEDWRESKVVTWYRQGKPYGDDEPRAESVKIYGTLQDKQAFGELFWASGYEYTADLAEEVVVVSDGAVWIWDLVSTYFPKATQIIDWTHAVEYLHAIRQASNAKNGTYSDEWLTESIKLRWEGNVQDVIERCQVIANSHDAAAGAASTAAGYYNRHAHRMDYARLRKQGYFIGSGTIESGIKRLIGARMKIAGAHWNMDSGEMVIKARCHYLNTRARLSLPLAV
ncbi:MAG: hypothetical protein OHK0052_17180 [Anaerolineales bacterium]